MSNRCRYLLLGFLIALHHSHSWAQDNFGIKFFGLSIHPLGEKDNAHLMPHKLDPQGYLVMNLGVVLSYEKFVVEDALSFKFGIAQYADCAAQWGGFLHAGIRAKIFKIKKHALYGGIGPTFIFRRNWHTLDGYINRNRFIGDKDDFIQYKFLWYGGEFEYRFNFYRAWDLSISFVPGFPDLVSLSIGVNYRFRDN
ncbi:MAG: hypothetical protein N2167_08085 [Flavobacteriales bacterium]|nr:hypothetical protein [Flavobacteriales bacterium]